MSRTLVALAVCAAILPTAAETAVTEDNFLMRTAGDFVALCSAGPADPMMTAAINFCQGFAVGVYQVLREEAAARPSMQLFCVPSPTPSRNSVIAEFVQWGRANSGEMSQVPAEGFVRFLAQRYPCPGRR